MNDPSCDVMPMTQPPLHFEIMAMVGLALSMEMTIQPGQTWGQFKRAIVEAADEGSRRAALNLW